MAKNKNEVRCKFINQSALDFSHSPGSVLCIFMILLWTILSVDLVFHVDAAALEDLKVENKKLVLRKKILMTKHLPAVLSRVNNNMGLDLIKEYLPPVAAEWNPMLVQKQECLHHVCRHLDRTRVLLVRPQIRLNIKIWCSML